LSNKTIHIISFDIPYPADYGGVIDVFYKIKALHAIDVKVILHCFQYGNRTPQEELNKYCEKIYYYKRKVGLQGISLKLPYIVYSRRSKTLLKNLCLDDCPILFEGMHTTYYINHPFLKDRFKLLRMHNVEEDYYKSLATSASSFFKKIYFNIERLYICHYSKWGFANKVYAITNMDKKYFQKYHESVQYLPAFHSHEQVTSKIGKGDYCLFHGNLSVQENIDAVDFLVHKVFNDLDIPLVIAGKNPSKYIQDICSKYKIKLVENPTNTSMNNLIQNAQCILLTTFQPTGVKLKLLNSLFLGRFVLVNEPMTSGTKLENVCINCKDENEFKFAIKKHYILNFTQEEINQRNDFLNKQYNNKLSAEFIVDLLR
jgi:hypothetical protein